MRMQCAALVVASLLVSAATGCRVSKDDGAGVKTNLADNDAVAEAVTAYKSNAAHCAPAPGKKRAMIAGFGLFSAPYNVSGIVAMSMAKAGFFPDKIKLGADAAPVAREKFWRHGETPTSNGGAAIQRALEIDGESYEVCFLLLDVKWDQAAAIVVGEAAVFKPKLIILSGTNGADPNGVTFESAALNNAGRAPGFDDSGRVLDANTRFGADVRVLPDLETNEKVALTWDATALAAANAPLIAAVPGASPPYSVAVGVARADNNFVCNNVSLVVARATTNHSVSLAGGRIELSGQDNKTITGFLHYPANAALEGHANDGGQIFAWAQVVANTIKMQLATTIPD